MKRYAAMLLMAALAADAGAAVITDFVPVDVGAAAGVPVGFAVYDMVVTTGSDWTNERLDLTLTSGTLYQDALGGDAAANPSLLSYAPSLEWDTYAMAPSGPTQPPGFAGEPLIDSTHFQASWFDCVSGEGGAF
jgi:hypothetical protein